MSPTASKIADIYITGRANRDTVRVFGDFNPQDRHLRSHQAAHAHYERQLIQPNDEVFEREMGIRSGYNVRPPTTKPMSINKRKHQGHAAATKLLVGNDERLKVQGVAFMGLPYLEDEKYLAEAHALTRSNPLTGAKELCPVYEITNMHEIEFFEKYYDRTNTGAVDYQTDTNKICRRVARMLMLNYCTQVIAPTF